MTDGSDFALKINRIETLVGRLERSTDPQACDAARELTSALLDVHALGLTRLVQALEESGPLGRDLLARAVLEESVAGLLLMHGLSPLDVRARVEQALAEARPYLNSHGGDVELASVTAGHVRLRMTGHCGHCPSSTATVRSVIEDAIRAAAPEVTTIELDQAAPADAAPSMVQIAPLAACANVT